MSKYPRDFVSIDFETAYSPRLSVCSVGLVKYINNKPVDSYYSLVQPPWEAIPESSKSNLAIHGIYDHDLIDQKFWPEILHEMEDFCGDLILLAHNSPFEKSCINKCNEYYGLTTSLNYVNMLDTLKITKEVEPLFGFKLKGAGTRRLNTLCEMYRVDWGTHHNALDDSYMCGDLLVKFNEFFDMNPDERKELHLTVPEPIIEFFDEPGSVKVEDMLIFD